MGEWNGYFYESEMYVHSWKNRNHYFIRSTAKIVKNICIIFDMRQIWKSIWSLDVLRNMFCPISLLVYKNSIFTEFYFSNKRIVYNGSDISILRLLNHNMERQRIRKIYLAFKKVIKIIFELAHFKRVLNIS